MICSPLGCPPEVTKSLLFFLPDQGLSALVVLITFWVQQFLVVGGSPVIAACLAASMASRCLECLFTIVTASNPPQMSPLAEDHCSFVFSV